MTRVGIFRRKSEIWQKICNRPRRGNEKGGTVDPREKKQTNTKLLQEGCNNQCCKDDEKPLITRVGSAVAHVISRLKNLVCYTRENSKT